ncbi:MAG: MFS transporter [Bacteroidota bacterium]|nr:MFS transporter [Bacteroidota bacterium]
MVTNASFKALQIPAFRYFLSTRLFLTLALQMQAVIVGWEIYKLTGDPFSLGLIGLAEAIPAISIALYAGHIADLHNKKTILTISLIALIVCSIGLGFFTQTHIKSVLNTQQIVWAIYGFIFLSGFARGFYAPSSFSFLSQLVPREILTYASTINSTAWQFAAVIGPALGGLCYAFWGIENTFILIVSLSVLALVSLIKIKGEFEPKSYAVEKISVRLREGIAFVYHNKIILSALSLDLFSVLFGGATALLPVFAGEILKTGPEGLGLLRAAPSLGAVLTMIVLSMRKTIKNAGNILIKAVAGFGICMIAFGLSENFYLSLFLLFLSGAFDSISVVIRANILQLQTPDEMRGRVSSVNTIFIGSSNEIGAFESGLAAKLIGTVNSVVFGGLMTLGIVGITQWKAKQLKKLVFNH